MATTQYWYVVQELASAKQLEKQPEEQAFHRPGVQMGIVQPPVAVSCSAAGPASRPRGNVAGTRAQGRSVLRPIVCPVALRLTKVEAHHSSVNLRPRPSPKSHPLGLCAPPACSKQDMAALTMTYYAY